MNKFAAGSVRIHRSSSIFVRRVLSLNFVGLILACLFLLQPIEGQESGGQQLSNVFDVERKEMPLIEPGTVIEDKAPEGWTHLILKSNPAVTKGDVDDISDGDKELSSMVRTASLANVVKRKIGESELYQLSHVAIGLCVQIDGRDTVVSPDTQKKLGADLGFLARTVLGKIYDEQAKVEIVARSDHALIYDAPIVIRWNGKNREELLRYAIMVDPATGELKTYVWMIELSKGKYLGARGKIQLLTEQCVIQCDLFVDSSEYTFGIPSKIAYACTSIPTGSKELDFPESIESIAGAKSLSSDEAAALIQALAALK